MPRFGVGGVGCAARAVVFASPLLISVSLASAQDAPPLRVGPHVQVAASVAGPLEYQDIGETDDPSFAIAATTTYRGVTGSIWHGQSMISGSTRATEALVGYSYKVPVVDVHLGAAFCDVSGLLPSCRSGARLAVTSHSVPRSTIGLVLNQAASSRDRTIAAAATVALIRAREIRVDAHVSATAWRYTEFNATGGSVRVLITRRLTRHLTSESSFGYDVSRLEAQQHVRDRRTALVSFGVRCRF